MRARAPDGQPAGRRLYTSIISKIGSGLRVGAEGQGNSATGLEGQFCCFFVRNHFIRRDNSRSNKD